MRPIALILLLAVAASAAATGIVGVDDLVGATARVGDEVDSILARARQNLDRMSPAAPPAPHVSGPTAPIQISLMETGETARSTVAQGHGHSGSSSTGRLQQLQNQQRQQQQQQQHQQQMRQRQHQQQRQQRQYQQRRAVASASASASSKVATGSHVGYNPSSDTMKALREIMPHKVVLSSRYPTGSKHEVEEAIRASEVLPNDPDADNMLNHFNKKYRVYDQLGISSLMEKRTDLPDKDLFDEQLDGLSTVQRDYKSIYSGANVDTFNPETDNPASLDNMLGTLWSKRWETMDGEMKEAAQKKDNVLITRITPEFASEMVQDGHDSSIGKVYTTASNKDPSMVEDDEGNVIPNRSNFAPREYWYGPRVFDQALDTTTAASMKDGISSPPRPPLESFITPAYEAADPSIKTIETIRITGPGELSEPTPVQENIFHPQMETRERLLGAKKVWVLDDVVNTPPQF